MQCTEWQLLVTPAWHRDSRWCCSQHRTTTHDSCTSAHIFAQGRCKMPVAPVLDTLWAVSYVWVYARRSPLQQGVCCFHPRVPQQQALVTSLCWRPDGKQLAAGHADGSISILDVETGDILSANKVHYAGIASLQWSDQAGPAHASTAFGGKSAGKQPQVPAGQLLAPQHSMLPHQRFKRLFAPPELAPLAPSSTEALPEPYDMCIEATAAAAWPTERAGLSLLCAGDARGHVSLWLQGQVQIAEVAGGVPSSSSSSSSSSSEGGEGSPADGPYQLLHVSCILPQANLDYVLHPVPGTALDKGSSALAGLSCGPKQTLC
jgi:hypothetical protein